MSALCPAPSRPVRNPTTRGESCGCVDESFAPARALRAVWTSPWTTRTLAHRPCPHSRPQAPQDQPPVILTGQHRSTLRRGCLHRLFKTTSAPHSNRSQHRPRAGSPPILQAHFRMGLDWSAFTCRWSSNHCRRLSGSRTPRNDGRNRGASSAFLAATDLQSARSVAAHPANDASRVGTNAHFTTSFLLRIDYHIFNS